MLLNTFFLLIIEKDLVFDIMKYFVECYHDQTTWSAHDRSLSLILSSWQSAESGTELSQEKILSKSQPIHFLCKSCSRLTVHCVMWSWAGREAVICNNYEFNIKLISSHDQQMTSLLTVEHHN